jgi:hypothetical protein
MGASIMTYLYNAYLTFILNPFPSKTWQVIRFILHWITLPIKLIIIGLLGIYGILYNKFTYKTKSFPDISLETKKLYTKKIFGFMPTFNNDWYNLYLARQPYYAPVNGINHVTDHQCLRQGQYTFMLNNFKQDDHKADFALHQHLSGNWLLRGYKWNFNDSQLVLNANSTSGDMLLGLSLRMLTSNDSILKEKYEQLVSNIIEFDYSLLEGSEPSDSPASDLWNKLFKQSDERIEKIRMKSTRGMWQPGLETVGAQALTVLAAIRIADKKLGNKDARKEYKKLLYAYGYGLLSLVPTAYIPNSRGYFNDSNCLHALYILSQLSDSRLGRLFWKLPMVYVWLLSHSWLNPYFTGLLEKAHPGTVSKTYIDQCQNYLFSTEPATAVYNQDQAEQVKAVPVNPNLIVYDEFNWECSMDCNIVPQFNNPEYRTGLGFLCAVSLIEPNPEKLLE